MISPHHFHPTNGGPRILITKTGSKYREIARAMGVKNVDKMTMPQYRKAAIVAVEKLAKDVGIPADLKGVLKMLNS